MVMSYDEVGFNPPVPKGNSSSNSQQGRGVGQHVLHLVRQIENGPSDLNCGAARLRYDEEMDELVELLNCQTAMCSRRGIFQGDIEKANQVLESPVIGNPNAKSRGKKGKKERSNADLSLNNHRQNADGLFVNDLDETSSITQQLQESLFLTGILRLLNLDTTQSRLDHSDRSSSLLMEDDRVLLVTLAANLSGALAQYIKIASCGFQGVTIFQGEYELLAKYGKQMLAGCAKQLQRMDEEIQRQLDLSLIHI